MWALIKQFPMPGELRDGIIYCQRSLRDTVLQHQNLASKINKLPKHQRLKVKQFMLELENEILEIGQEQAAFVSMLSQRLKAFRAYVLQKTNIAISDEIANGYVSRVLTNHSDSFGINSTPLICKKRLSASELAQKYCLENFTKLEKFVDDDNANFAPWNTGGTLQQDEKVKKVEPNTYGLKASSAPPVTPDISSSSSSSPLPVTTVTSRSLLKPKQERLNQEQALKDSGAASVKHESVERERRAFASVIETESVADIKVEDVKSEAYDEETTANTEKPAAITPTAVASTKQPQIYPRPGGIWMPGLRGRPPKGVKYVPASKLATIQAQQRENYLRRMRQAMAGGGGVRQRGRPPKIPLLKLEVPPSPPREPEPVVELDSSEEQSTPASFERPSAAVRRGRSNLQMALNRLKRPLASDETAETIINTTAREMAKKSAKSCSSAGGKLAKNGTSGSSGSSPSSRSSTPTLSLGARIVAASDDSSDRRCDPLPDLSPCAEPVVPLPNDIWELGMKALLNYLQLCTPEEAKAHRERRQERKRRSCYSTERKDFHYGRFDYYEQQQLQAATRASRRAHQRPILYSPPVVSKKRKHQQQQSQHGTVRASGNGGLSGITSTTRQTAPTRCLSVDSRDIFAAMSNRSCFVCNKTTPSLELSACTNCCNIYHISCHQAGDDDTEEDTHLFQHRDDLCPVCLTTEDDGDNK